MPDARRTKVKGKPSVYFRELGGRRRYEITYVDSDGRRRWQTVPGFDNLDEAEAALGDVRQRLRKGERVAPSRQSFSELHDEWAAQLGVSERTREHYERDVRLHLLPRFGRRRAQEVTTDDVARLIVELGQKGLAGWTVRGVLTALSAMYAWAVRRGKAPLNPVSGLERGERPAAEGREKRILSREEIGRFLGDAPEPIASCWRRPYSAACACKSSWACAGSMWDRTRCTFGISSRAGGALMPLKTNAGKRDVALMPELATLLRRHRLASRHSHPEGFVFAGAAGKPLHFRNVQRRGMDEAVERAKLDQGKRAPTMHDWRHSFASLLIARNRLDLRFGISRHSATLTRPPRSGSMRLSSTRSAMPTLLAPR